MSEETINLRSRIIRLEYLQSTTNYILIMMTIVVLSLAIAVVFLK